MEVECSFVRDALQARLAPFACPAAEAACCRWGSWLSPGAAAACDRGWPALALPRRASPLPPTARPPRRARPQGDDVSEMRLRLVASAPESYPFKDDD